MSAVATEISPAIANTAQQLPAELLAVAAACAAVCDPSQKERLHQLFAAGIDAERMFRIAQRHRVVALAYRGLESVANQLPTPLQQQWKQQAMQQSMTALALAAESVKLQREMDSAGIPVIFLKGSTLATLAFGDLALRQAKDIDILVPATSIARAEALLRTRGYVRTAPPEDATEADVAAWRSRSKDTSWYHPTTRTEVELHWSLSDSGPDQSTTEDDVQWIAIGSGQRLRTLRTDLLLRYLCLHGASHAWSRMKWLADVQALLLAGGNGAAERLYAGAEQGRERRSVGQALLLCDTLFHLPLSSALLRTVRQQWPVSLLAWIALRVMTSGNAERELLETPFASSLVYLSRLLLASNASERWREATLSILPAEEAQAARAAGRMPALAPAVRIWKWAGKHLARGMRS